MENYTSENSGDIVTFSGCPKSGLSKTGLVQIPDANLATRLCDATLKLFQIRTQSCVVQPLGAKFILLF